MKDMIRYIVLVLAITGIFGAGIIYLNSTGHIDGFQIKIADPEKKEDSIISEFASINETNKKLKAELDKIRADYLFLNKSFTDSKDQGMPYEEKKEVSEKEEFNLTANMADLLDEIETYKKDIKDSLEWFRRNSEITDIPNEDIIKNSLNEKCLIRSNKTCFIKLGCLYLVNTDMNFEYKEDSSTYGEEDRLQSLYEFTRNWGGDCEDYALFFKAELNYMIRECKDKSIRYETWKSGKDKYFLDTENIWYIESAKPYTIVETHPVVVCGNLYDRKSGKVNGHCLIAFTKKPIIKREDISYLYYSPMVEPQTGQYEARIGKEVSLGHDDKKQEIFMVITDNDLFLYNKDTDGWMSYSHFEDLLEIVNMDLQALIDKR